MDSPGLPSGPQVQAAALNLTRRCNLACGYCGVIRTQFPVELDANQWMRALSVLERIGVRRVTISGGEPTLVPELPDILRFARDQTSLHCFLVSNSTFADELVAVYAEAGLRGYYTSIDTLGGSPVDESSWIKSEAAWGKIPLFREAGLALVGVNLLIHRGNLDEVPAVVERLTEMGASVHPVILHWGPGAHWQNRASDSLMKLLPSDAPRVAALSAHLVQMKRAGYLIDASESFLADIARYAIGLNWHCQPNPRKLRVDANGAVSCCQDLLGRVADRYRIFDFEDPDRWAAFLRDWGEDSRPCPGCFYTDIYEAHVSQRTRAEG
jgi:MoaA/NifB/PqqE/SkfB family radical SAM enzyme